MAICLANLASDVLISVVIVVAVISYSVLVSYTSNSPDPFLV